MYSEIRLRPVVLPQNIGQDTSERFAPATKAALLAAVQSMNVLETEQARIAVSMAREVELAIFGIVFMAALALSSPYLSLFILPSLVYLFLAHRVNNEKNQLVTKKMWEVWEAALSIGTVKILSLDSTVDASSG